MAKNNILTRAKRKQADMLFKGNRLHEAKEAYGRICQIDKADAESWFMLGVIHGNLKNADEAMACFSKAIELRPDYALAHYNIGNLLYVQGKPEEAVKAFREAIRMDSQYAAAHGNLGYALLTLGRDDEALSCFREQARLNPENADALTNLGNLQ
jgi:tetratricopeptide (TPR) repeat protein